MNLVMKEKFGIFISIDIEFDLALLSNMFRFGKGILAKLIDTVCQLVDDKETTSILDIGTGQYKFSLLFD